MIRQGRLRVHLPNATKVLLRKLAGSRIMSHMWISVNAPAPRACRLTGSPRSRGDCRRRGACQIYQTTNGLPWTLHPRRQSQSSNTFEPLLRVRKERNYSNVC